MRPAQPSRKHVTLCYNCVFPMRPLRISAISFLNTAPLMWDFEHGGLSPETAARFEVEYTVPSKCAEQLLAGTADIGIIPSITFATIPDLAILPDVAIAAKGAVRSILLVTKKPLEDVRTVALDTSSRTSVALTKVLLSRFLPGQAGEREYRPMAPKVDEMLAECDAGLLIGDPALQVDLDRYTAYDLAQEWRRVTGKPFVFAFWAVRLPALSEAPRDLELDQIFCQSRDHGLEPQAIDAIAREWAPRLAISENVVRNYLTHHIYYRLDPETLEGLELFYQYAAELQLIPAAPVLRFLGRMAFKYYR